ncbi:MAG: 30S ribosome-binding factor RbfA [Sandaracinaceae bacterium]|nr:30S ribosome-binding factor RbfA [Sandaracinaceae bacterium]
MTAERTARVAERIRAEVMDLLLTGKIKDPATHGAVVHAVQVTADLRQARVYVRLDELEPSDARKKALMRGLGRAEGYIRREVGKRLELRYSPELTFLWDDTVERASRIEEILDEISKE